MKKFALLFFASFFTPTASLFAMDIDAKELRNYCIESNTTSITTIKKFKGEALTIMENWAIEMGTTYRNDTEGYIELNRQIQEKIQKMTKNEEEQKKLFIYLESVMNSAKDYSLMRMY